MNYFSVLFKISKKNLKYRILLIAAVLLAIIQTFFTLSQNRQVLLEENSADRLAVQSVLSEFKKVDLSAPDAKNDPLYTNLVQQSELLARKEQTLLFNNCPLFIDTSIELSTIRKDFRSLPGAENYASYLPAPSDNQLENAFYTRIKKADIPLMTQNNTIVMSMLTLFSLLGILWFPMTTLITNDLLLEELRHLSLTNGFPLALKKRLLTKIGFTTGFLLLALGAVYLVCMAFAVHFPIGDLNYPVPVFLTSYTTLPFIGYLGILTFYFLLLAVFACLLSIVLNYLLNDFYLSLFFSFGLYLLPFFFPAASAKLWFLPAISLDPVKLLQGKYLEFSNCGNYFFGIMVLLFWCLLFLIVIKRMITINTLRDRR